MCRYCEPNGDDKEMCVDCKRRYNRLSLNRSKLTRLHSSADEALITNKILDDLAVYADLMERGCAVPPVVEAVMCQFRDVKKSKPVCRYCGNSIESDEDMYNTRMCVDCYKFYNYFNVLYNGPKRPAAVKTRQTYRGMLDEIAGRRDKGLKIPGVAVRALAEDWRDDELMETESRREPAANPSIRRRQH